jgi:hypothetical protein
VQADHHRIAIGDVPAEILDLVGIDVGQSRIRPSRAG